MGHLEEEILHQTHELERALLGEAAQQKADAKPPVCPVCGHKRTQRTRGHARTYQTRFGPITVRRLRGWCRRCRVWRFPADHKQARDSYQESLRGVVAEQSAANAKLVTCLDNNTRVLEECRDELRHARLERSKT